MLLPQQIFALRVIIGGFAVFETFHYMESLSLPGRHTLCAFFAALGGTLGGEAAKKPHGMKFRAAFQNRLRSDFPIVPEVGDIVVFFQHFNQLVHVFEVILA